MPRAKKISRHPQPIIFRGGEIFFLAPESPLENCLVLGKSCFHHSEKACPANIVVPELDMLPDHAVQSVWKGSFFRFFYYYFRPKIANKKIGKRTFFKKSFFFIHFSFRARSKKVFSELLFTFHRQK